ncbi:hypothetical protein [Sulfurimonas sp.]|uniref:hypothetical protein n=1 Tax=Sulfurimonas sp. TaxID=2022749 RepID=UPI002AB1BB85|nr:hypothetical protein [Sulfurimonas sp.]
MIKLLSSFLLLFVLVGCNSQPAPSASNGTPTWILNPNQDGKNGAVGSSMRTYDQKMSSQRRLAITRALDELSLQRGVKVQMSMTKQESYTNGKGNTRINVGANYQTNNMITAHIQKIYQDKISGELFVWMVID